MGSELLHLGPGPCHDGSQKKPSSRRKKNFKRFAFNLWSGGEKGKKREKGGHSFPLGS